MVLWYEAPARYKKLEEARKSGDKAAIKKAQQELDSYLAAFPKSDHAGDDDLGNLEKRVSAVETQVARIRRGRR